MGKRTTGVEVFCFFAFFFFETCTVWMKVDGQSYDRDISPAESWGQLIRGQMALIMTVELKLQRGWLNEISKSQLFGKDQFRMQRKGFSSKAHF